MGAVSEAVASAARGFGAEIVTNAAVSEILLDDDGGGSGSGSGGSGAAGWVRGVRVGEGAQAADVRADAVLSGCAPYHTFLELLPGGYAPYGASTGGGSPLPDAFRRHIRFTDFACGALKINCAVDALPDFECAPNADIPGPPGTPGPQHRGTVHFENTMGELEDAYREASAGIPATRPAIEMTVPSAVDPTLAPPGKHVVQFFVQYAPYDVDPKAGSWADPGFKDAFADRVFAVVDEFCPGFSDSVLYRDVLSPLDLERVFGLHKGNIFHGSLAVHQLVYGRPAPGHASHRSPVPGLYMCSAGTHPGGGVMGAAGRNAARIVLDDWGA